MNPTDELDAAFENIRLGLLRAIPDDDTRIEAIMAFDELRKATMGLLRARPTDAPPSSEEIVQGVAQNLTAAGVYRP